MNNLRAVFLLFGVIVIGLAMSAILNYSFEKIDPGLDLVLSGGSAILIMRMTDRKE